MKDTMKFTPKGLTQNWNFLQHYTGSKKKDKGGSFVSRIESNRPIYKEPFSPKEIILKNGEQGISFSSKKSENGEVKISVRKNGKFYGKSQTYSASLAQKLGII